MSDLKTLREQMAQIATEARAKLSEVTDTTPEERAAEVEREFDAAMAQHDKLAERVAREERVASAFAKLEETDTSKIPAVEGRTSKAVDAGLELTHRQAFAEYVSAGGEAYMDAETRSVLQEYRAQTVGTGSAGGFTAPTEVANFIVESMAASGPMYTSNVFSVLDTTNGNTVNIPTLNNTARTGAAHTEGGAVTDDGGSDAVFGQKSVGAFSFNSEWVRWSAELNADSLFNMESLLGRLIGEGLGRLVNEKLTTGSGSSDVEGIMTNSTAGLTAAATAAITSDEIIDLVHSVDQQRRASASTAFMMNDSTLAAVRKLKDGNGNYLWALGNYQAGTPDTLLGYPVFVNQAMDSLAAAKKVMAFGDMSAYYVRKAGGPSITVARERFAPDYGILGFVRVDGVLADTAAVKHLITAAS
jgi:HK97 family phage major capsid protein